MPNPAEVATLVVNRDRFSDWKSVWVQRRRLESEHQFRFTAVERDPNPGLWKTAQLKPGDECAIYLGVQLAVAGVIVTRQVAYDGKQHGVMLFGKGLSWYAARGSILKKQNFDGKTLMQIATEILAPFGQVPIPIGKVDDTPFKRAQSEQGMTVWGYLEELARTKSVILGSDHQGSILLIGKHTLRRSASLIEGDNILKCQCVIDVNQKYSAYILSSQSPADDSHYGPAAAFLQSVFAGTAAKYSPLLQVASVPPWDEAELKTRAAFEAQWAEGTAVTAHITVQGWHMPRGFLWEEGKSYLVKSPMAMLNQELVAEKVTFTQDSDQGTLTQLELVAPWKLNAKSDYNFGINTIDIDPGTIPAKILLEDTGPLDKAPVTLDPPRDSGKG